MRSRGPGQLLVRLFHGRADPRLVPVLSIQFHDAAKRNLRREHHGKPSKIEAVAESARASGRSQPRTNRIRTLLTGPLRGPRPRRPMWPWAAVQAELRRAPTRTSAKAPKVAAGRLQAWRNRTRLPGTRSAAGSTARP